jgi:hypothetical protein
VKAQTVARRSNDIRQAPLWLWAAHYLLFVGVLYVCFQGFWLWRSSIESLTAVIFYRDLWRQPAYMTGTALVGLALFVVALGAEAYVRGALTGPLPRGSFVARFAGRLARVLLMLVLVVGSGAAVQELLFRAVR